jgi:TetR/AcrR family transcriptional regulator, cholesterol catabolism regulator
VEDQTPRPGRQADILKTFTDMVAERGYDQTSIGEIAAVLALSKGTIMYHFGSKDRLLQQMSLEYMRRRSTELEAIVESDAGDAQKIADLITSLLIGFRDDRSSTIAFSREFMRFADAPVMSEVRELRRGYITTLSRLIEDGVRSGELREVDPRIVALQIIGMCSWCWTWFRPDGRLTAEQVGAMFADSLVGGLATLGADALPAVAGVATTARPGRVRRRQRT